jgi:hypothetical protein
LHSSEAGSSFRQLRHKKPSFNSSQDTNCSTPSLSIKRNEVPRPPLYQPL